MKTSIVLAVGLASTLYAGLASATHKAWLLKNGGAECFPFSPSLTGETPSTTGFMVNNHTSSQLFICPVALAARWGSSSYALFNPPRWANALSAHVYVKKVGSASVGCYAAAQSYAGAFYYSSTKTDVGPAGVRRIDLALQSSWGGSLETNENMVVRSMDFACTLSSGGTAIMGYKLKNCQNVSQCNDGSEDPEEASGGGGGENTENYIQTNGMECSPRVASEAANLVRNDDGIKNTGTTGMRSVFCPLAPPSDDSREHSRYVSSTRVFYKGGSTAGNCVASGTCPRCKLHFWDRAGIGQVDGDFTIRSFGDTFLTQPNGAGRVTVGNEVEVGVDCDLPPGVTLNGISSVMSVTTISGGI